MLSHEQLEARRHRIGASDVAKICGLSKWGTPFDVFIEKTQGIYKPAGEAAALGSRLEPAILDWAEQDYGLLITKIAIEEPYSKSDFPLVVSLDAITDRNEPVNAKTAGLTGGSVDDWGEAETDEIPEEYRIQEQAEMLATGADIAFVPALIVRRGFVMFRVPRNEEMIGYIKEICARFWRDHVMTGTPPPVGDNPPDPWVLKHLKREPKSVIELPEIAATQFEELKSRESLVREHTKWIDAEKARIIAALGTAEAGRLPDGRLITYFEETRNMPAKEAYTQRFRRLRITKGSE